MPIYTQACQSPDCGLIFEDLRTLSCWQENPPCRDCGGVTDRILRPQTVCSTTDPIVVFQAPDGTFRFPGEANSISTGRYAAAGYQRLEIHNAADMRRFETHMNKREASLMARKLERRQEARERRESESHAALRHGLDQGFMLPEVDPSTGHRTGRMVRVHLSERGRDVVRHTIQRNNDRPKERTADPNFHSEVFSFDRGSRERSRDAHGRRHRD